MNDVTQQFQAMQGMMRVPAAAVEENVRCAWNIQNKILDSMENVANGGFERRHVGTRAALEAAQRMCKAQTPVDLAREYQDWTSGAFQRLMADGYGCQQFVGAFAGLIQETELQRFEKTTPHRKAA
jgi:hypothetical protein